MRGLEDGRPLASRRMPPGRADAMKLGALALVLEFVCRTNNDLRDLSPTLFDAVCIPNMPLKDYVERIRRYASLDFTCFLVALSYLDRLVSGSRSFCPTIHNIHRLLATSLLVASKAINEVSPTNLFMARCGGIGVSELNRLEVELCCRLGWRLLPSAPQLHRIQLALDDDQSEADDGKASLAFWRSWRSVPSRKRPLSSNSSNGSASALSNTGETTGEEAAEDEIFDDSGDDDVWECGWAEEWSKAKQAAEEEAEEWMSAKMAEAKKIKLNELASEWAVKEAADSRRLKEVKDDAQAMAQAKAEANASLVTGCVCKRKLPQVSFGCAREGQDACAGGGSARAYACVRRLASGRSLSCPPVPPSNKRPFPDALADPPLSPRRRPRRRRTRTRAPRRMRRARGRRWRRRARSERRRD